MLLFLVEIAILAFLIIWGLNHGGALGACCYSVLGILILTFVFHVQPGTIPINAILIVLSIAIAGGTLEVTGGINYLVYLAAKLIKRYPKLVTFISPLVTWVFCFGTGTSNIFLSLEPIVAETAFEARIRPKRPLVVSVFAANMAVLCSPAAAATGFIITLLAAHGVNLHEYLAIVVPTALITIILLSVFMTFYGSRKVSDKEAVEQHIQDMKHTEMANDFSTKTKVSVVIFILGILSILLLGIFPNLAPHFVIKGKNTAINMDIIVQLFMYSSAALNLLVTKINYRKILTSKITKSAFGAAFAILGPGWFGGTVFSNPQNLKIIKSTVGSLITQSNLWVIPVVMIVAMFCMSQAATSAIVLPLALSLGVTPLLIPAIIQAVNFNFVIPAQPTILFAEDLDKTGGTSKYGFFIPGCFFVIVSFIVGVLIMHII